MGRSLIIGASGGIGRALADILKVQGSDVTSLSRSADGLDLRDAASIDRVLRAVEGPFDTVLLATGILAPADRAPEKSLGALDAAALREVIEVNAIGPALVIRDAPRLLARKGRSVLGVLSARIGSIGDNHLGGWHAYRASKAALNQIVRCAAIELGRTHREAVVAALHPGTVATPFSAAYSPPYDKLAPPEAARRLLRTLDRLTPAETGRFWDHEGREVPW